MKRKFYRAPRYSDAQLRDWLIDTMQSEPKDDPTVNEEYDMLCHRCYRPAEDQVGIEFDWAEEMQMLANGARY